LLAQTMNDVGRLARGLRPAALDDLGLRAALERFASDQAAVFGFRISVEAASLGRKRLPPEIETALYRAAQEALANAARHASPSTVRITLRRAAEIVSLTVSDDGRGFDAAQAASSGLGLHTVRERAELLGGRAEVRSAPGAGTTVRLEIPLPASPRRRAR
jgi:signal transduction histidine kinase